jgi:hypothetical protein
MIFETCKCVTLDNSNGFSHQNSGDAEHYLARTFLYLEYNFLEDLSIFVVTEIVLTCCTLVLCLFNFCSEITQPVHG